jgi:hypothetical protein
MPSSCGGLENRPAQRADYDGGDGSGHERDRRCGTALSPLTPTRWHWSTRASSGMPQDDRDRSGLQPAGVCRSASQYLRSSERGPCARPHCPCSSNLRVANVERTTWEFNCERGRQLPCGGSIGLLTLMVLRCTSGQWLAKLDRTATSTQVRDVPPRRWCSRAGTLVGTGVLMSASSTLGDSTRDGRPSATRPPWRASARPPSTSKANESLTLIARGSGGSLPGGLGGVVRGGHDAVRLS